MASTFLSNNDASVSYLQSDLDVTINDIKNLETDVANLTTTVSGHTTLIVDQDTDISNLTTTVNGNSSTISNLITSIVTNDGLISQAATYGVNAQNTADANTGLINTNITNIGTDSKRVIPTFNRKMSSAVSLRKIVESATLCCRIRNSDSNAEIDVGFDSNGIIDKTTIDSHVGAFDPYIVRWYDQTGRGNDFITKGGAQARESKLIWSNINGTADIPECDFNGINDTTGNHYVCVRTAKETGYNDPAFGQTCIFRITARPSNCSLFGSSWAYFQHQFTSDTNLQVNLNAILLDFNVGSSVVANGFHTLTAKTDNFSTNIRIDGTEITAQTSGINIAMNSPVGFGGVGNVDTGHLQGAINEHIIWSEYPTSVELLALENQQNAIWISGDLIPNNTTIVNNIEYNERKVNSNLLIDTTTESYNKNEGAFVCQSMGCLGNLNIGGDLKVDRGIGLGVYNTLDRERLLPYTGLMVYDSDLSAMYFYTGSVWKKITAV